MLLSVKTPTEQQMETQDNVVHAESLDKQTIIITNSVLKTHPLEVWLRSDVQQSGRGQGHPGSR